MRACLPGWSNGRYRGYALHFRVYDTPGEISDRKGHVLLTRSTQLNAYQVTDRIREHAKRTDTGSLLHAETSIDPYFPGKRCWYNPGYPYKCKQL